jgi:integrase
MPRAKPSDGWILTDAFARKPPPIPAGAGRDDYIYFDSKLPRFGLRRRNGNLSWIIQYRVRGSTRRRTLGPAAGPLAISCKTARGVAEARLAEITLGANPRSSRSGLRLSAETDRYLEGLRQGTIGVGRARDRKIRPRSLAALESHFAVHWQPLRNWSLHDIDRKAVADCLNELVAKRGAATANRARASLSGFFRWAMGNGLADANPVVGTNIAPESGPRERALDDDELADIWRACQDTDYGRIIRLLVLTGQRRQEVAGMADSEIDLPRRLWTLPGERTKNRREHTVPLSGAALTVIASQPRRVDRDLLFGDGSGPFSGWSSCKTRLDARITAARKAGGRPPMKAWIVHDLRRTVRTGLGKLNVAPHICEAVINHLPPTLIQTYDRNTYEREKRQALNAWAQHVSDLVGR